MSQQKKNTIIPEQKWNEKWWSERPDRVAMEEMAIDENYPDFEFGHHEGTMFVHGWLTTNNYNKYNVVITYPDNYPYSPPDPYIEEPDLDPYDIPHMYSNGVLCVLETSDETWENHSTAATMIGLVGAWLHAYEEWKETGYWPGDEAH